MDGLDKLKFINAQMAFEAAEDQSPTGNPYLETSKKCSHEIFVHPAVMPNGKRIKLLKTQLTSVCERDCNYCSFRAGRDFRRATFRPEEFARLFIMLTEKGIAEGTFLSSGIVGGGIHTQDLLLDTAEILRYKLGFLGYIHLKIMPGAEFAQVERAMQLADRISINLEAPNPERLARLAPKKLFNEELIQSLKWADQIRRTKPPYQGWKGHWPSSVTQFVAGGADETDLELLATTQFLYQDLGLKRAYFSRFNPIPDTPLENHPPTTPVREHRLYQASFLLRDYFYDLEELPFSYDGKLPENMDPKLAWAIRHLSDQPVEINRADRRALLRIPGIGPKGAETILRIRQQGGIQDVAAFHKLGMATNRAAPFVLINGHRPAFQLELFNPSCGINL